MKSSATESEKAALSLAFEKVTAKIEHKHSNSRSSSTADTDKFTYFISSVESIDVKAKISSMHRPPFTTEFTEKVMKVFEANGTDARKEQLTELVKSYTFYLKEVYAGSSYAQVGEQKTTQVSFIDHWFSKAVLKEGWALNSTIYFFLNLTEKFVQQFVFGSIGTIWI